MQLTAKVDVATGSWPESTECIHLDRTVYPLTMPFVLPRYRELKVGCIRSTQAVLIRP